MNLATTTPPQKRRRGRPPKCPSNAEGQPSPAAHSSAAVVRQGTPKASAPFMKISPLRGKKSSDSTFNSSPLQRMINPSPRGGLLMKLNDDQERPATKKIKRSSSSSSAGTIYSMTLSADKPKKDDSMNTFMTPPKISLSTQEGIHSLTSDSPSHKKTSVNPSLLLSSPMPNTHGFNNGNRVDDVKSKTMSTSSSNKMKSKSQKHLIASSPVTPNSLASSCFSSIIQSSPLYHGYYANQSSPSSALNSSPIKFQMKPIDLPELKKESNHNDILLPKIDELPKNPVNSPTLKPQDTELSKTSSRSSTPAKGEYKLTFSIDEFGQAKVLKVKDSKPKVSNSKLTRPKFTRHESLMNANSNPLGFGRSSSLSTIPQLKSQPSITGDLTDNSSHDYNEMFIEPSKMTSDPLSNDFSQPVELENLQGSEGSSYMNDVDELEDESMNYDARSALIKMIRRSI